MGLLKPSKYLPKNYLRNTTYRLQYLLKRKVSDYSSLVYLMFSAVIVKHTRYLLQKKKEVGLLLSFSGRLHGPRVCTKD